MKKVKTRWDREYHTNRRSAQNLIENAKRFRKKGWQGNVVENKIGNVQQVHTSANKPEKTS